MTSGSRLASLVISWSPHASVRLPRFFPDHHNMYQTNNRTGIKRQNALRWLNVGDASASQAEASKKRQPGTGVWFLNRPEYAAWKTERSSLLWLLGKGKFGTAQQRFLPANGSSGLRQVHIEVGSDQHPGTSLVCRYHCLTALTFIAPQSPRIFLHIRRYDQRSPWYTFISISAIRTDSLSRVLSVRY